MNIKEAKEQIANAVKAYLTKMNLANILFLLSGSGRFL